MNYKFTLITYKDNPYWQNDHWIYDIGTSDITKFIDISTIENLSTEIESNNLFELRSNTNYITVRSGIFDSNNLQINQSNLYGKYIKITINNQPFFLGKITNIYFDHNNYTTRLRLDGIDKIFYDTKIDAKSYNLFNKQTYTLKHYIDDIISSFRNELSHYELQIFENLLTFKDITPNPLIFSYNHTIIENQTIKSKAVKLQILKYPDDSNSQPTIIEENYFYQGKTEYGYIKRYYPLEPSQFEYVLLHQDWNYNSSDYRFEPDNPDGNGTILYYLRPINTEIDDDSETKNYFKNVIQLFWDNAITKYPSINSLYDTAEINYISFLKVTDNKYYLVYTNQYSQSERNDFKSDKYYNIIKLEYPETFSGLYYNFENTSIGSIIKAIAKAVNGYFYLDLNGELKFHNLSINYNTTTIYKKDIEKITTTIQNIPLNFSINSNIYFHPDKLTSYTKELNDIYENNIFERKIYFPNLKSFNIFDEIYINNERVGFIKNITHKNNKTMIITTDINLLNYEEKISETGEVAT